MNSSLIQYLAKFAIKYLQSVKKVNTVNISKIQGEITLKYFREVMKPSLNVKEVKKKTTISYISPIIIFYSMYITGCKHYINTEEKYYYQRRYYGY